MRSNQSSGSRPRAAAEAGMSLVEATIILMVIATLTAVIAPSARAYIIDAQQSAAKKDAETIATALNRMLSDVGEAWFVRSGARTGTATDHGAPAHGANTRVDMLVSGGSMPGMAATARGAGTDWTAAVNDAAIQLLDNYLVLNKPSNDVAKAYRDATTMTGTNNFDPSTGGGFNSPHAWRGAYVPGEIAPDPWGNRYMANVEFLARTQGSTGSGSVKDVFVLSAGPNARVNTVFEIDGVTSSSDDILALVAGSTR